MLQALEHRRSTNDASCFGHLGGYRMDYLASFFAAAFLCNCIPHLACGLRGETFPTPFANPRGKGPSIMNFLWGAFNLLVALYLLSKHPVTVSFEPGFLALVFGALAIGFYLSIPNDYPLGGLKLPCSGRERHGRESDPTQTSGVSGSRTLRDRTATDLAGSTATKPSERTNCRKTAKTFAIGRGLNG